MPIIRRDKDPDVVLVGDCPCDGWMIDLLMWVGSIIGLENFDHEVSQLFLNN